jgi:hypothetical protein
MQKITELFLTTNVAAVCTLFPVNFFESIL